MFIQHPHVSDRVNRDQNPEKRGRYGKNQTKGVCPQAQLKARRDGEQMALYDVALQNNGSHRNNDSELETAGDNGAAFPDIRPLAININQ